MILALIAALLIGLLAGTLTGLAPGIHINLVSAVLLSSLGFLAGIPPIALVVFIASMSLAHTFIDFIPSVFLGAPEEGSYLSVLPAHQMLKEGSGYEASVIALMGSLASIPAIIIISPVFIYFLPSVYSVISSIIPFLLIFISFYMLFREEAPWPGFIIFALSGLLGFSAFSLPISDPLLPMLTGLFGISSIVISIKTNTTINKQKIIPISSLLHSKKEFLPAALSSYISAPLCSFLPGIGSGHAAVIASEMSSQNSSPKKFIFLVGASSTIVMALSFVTLFSIGKSRTGSASAVNEILPSLNLSSLLIILAAVIISSILAFFIGIYISRLFAANISKINYKKLNFLILAILFAVNIYFTNALGLLVLITSSFLGIYCILSDSKRINMMGSLIIPSIIYYLL